MIRNPRPGSDLHRALVAIVRHPDALDSAELAAILWGRPKLAPLPPPTAATWATRAAAVKAREAELHRLTLEANARATRLLGRLVDAGLVEVRGAPRIAPWWPERAAKRGASEALRGLLMAEESGMLDEAPAVVEVDVGLCLELLGKVEKGPLSVRDVVGSEPSGTVKRAWAVLRELGIVLVGERRATVEGEKVAGAC